jgi:crotonobetainyl-CoA:carnitine CoA-transferase CaiB-like acyl-CoA transferase
MSQKPLAGVRVLEVASHVFVPVAGAVLTEWGAEVLKIEHPVTGDPYRGLVTAGLHKTHNGIDPSFQYANRGKQSIAIDLKVPEGRALLSRLVAESDVFLTNFRSAALATLKLEVDDVRADNPSIIYVRGTGYGTRGPDAERAGYDAAAYWTRTGMWSVFTQPDAEWPASPRPAFGDVMGGLTIAGAISTALYQRAVKGVAPVVDVSLLGVGMWQLQPDIMNVAIEPSGGATHAIARDRRESWNPLVGVYRTRDDRFVMLMMLDADKYWVDLCETIDAPELARDERFVDMAARRENSRACVDALDQVFASRDYDEWCKVLQRAKGAWAPVQTPVELLDDPQVIENEYLADVDMGSGASLTMVTSPVQFDGEAPAPTRAPEHGEHTELALLSLGLTWDDITALKDRNVIL